MPDMITKIFRRINQITTILPCLTGGFIDNETMILSGVDSNLLKGLLPMFLDRKLVTLALCGAAIAAWSGDVSAKPHRRHAPAPAVQATAGDDRFANAIASANAAPATEAETAAVGTRRQRAGTSSEMVSIASTSSSLVETARGYIGGNPTGRSSLWCGAFMDMVLKQTGRRGGGNLARGYAQYGRRVSSPQVGAIAVIGRRGGGHVGVVSGIDANGNPIVISGNHNRRVAESVYPASRVITYVLPE